MLRQFLIAAAFLLYLVPNVGASIVTNGPLHVDIRNDNGAIGAVVFSGIDFYNPGVAVSDFGMQFNINTSAFRRNTTTGLEGINFTSVTSSSGTITAIGQYLVPTFGANIGVTRKYSLVPGANALKISTTLTNLGAPLLGLRLFDTADPDQLGFPSTYNDRKVLGGGNVLQAQLASGLTTIWGFAAPGGFLGSFSGIPDGYALNNFFGTGGSDPNGAPQDIAMAIGFQTNLGAGQSLSFDYYQAYGVTIPAAEAAFIAATQPVVTPEPAAVPEPTALLVWLGLSAIGMSLTAKHLRQT